MIPLVRIIVFHCTLIELGTHDWTHSLGMYGIRNSLGIYFEISKLFQSMLSTVDHCLHHSRELYRDSLYPVANKFIKGRKASNLN
jgi:hypothetical protein